LPAGQRPKEDRDSTIVHPEHLPPKRASHICGFCHSMKWFDRNEGWQESGFRFRPGDDLDTTTPVIRPGRLADQPWLKPVLEKHPALLDDFFWPDGMIRVAGREYNGLIESACHQRGNLSCLSCHSLHDSDPNDQLAKGMDGNQACLQCHKSHASQLQQHTHHPAGSAGSLCYNCHMPHTSYALLKAVRSHQITSPNVQVTLDSGRPNACNACHVDQTLEWTSQHLARWYGQTPVQVPDLHRTTSATVRALLAGDAGQRALAAWHLGWTDAQQAAGNHWQPALLAFLLDDPYAAVRYIAQRSLRRHPTFAQLDYDFVGKSDHWQRAKTQVLERWRNLKPATVATNHLHIALTPDGGLDTTRVNRLQATRDNRPIRLRE
jgi:predicted CXXCH cytochrome family protein